MASTFMKIYLVNDQKGVIKAYPTFKEGTDAFNQLCQNHIKQCCENPTFVYKRFYSKFEDGCSLSQFRSSYKTTKNGKIRFINDIFSFQVIQIDEKA